MNKANTKLTIPSELTSDVIDALICNGNDYEAMRLKYGECENHHTLMTAASFRLAKRLGEHSPGRPFEVPTYYEWHSMWYALLNAGCWNEGMGKRFNVETFRTLAKQLGDPASLVDCEGLRREQLPEEMNR